jgi:hypothetical protein
LTVHIFILEAPPRRGEVGMKEGRCRGRKRAWGGGCQVSQEVGGEESREVGGNHERWVRGEESQEVGRRGGVTIGGEEGRSHNRWRRGEES